jgi:hypothetical protein
MGKTYYESFPTLAKFVPRYISVNSKKLNAKYILQNRCQITQFRRWACILLTIITFIFPYVFIRFPVIHHYFCQGHRILHCWFAFMFANEGVTKSVFGNIQNQLYHRTQIYGNVKGG